MNMPEGLRRSTEQQPALSVIVATHCRANLLGRAIRSIKSQAMDAVQVIVVSDTADKATAEIASRLLGGSDCYVQRGGDAGPAESRNLGLSLVAAPFVMFLDDDDSFDAGFLAQLRPYLRLDEARILYCDFDVVEEDRGQTPPLQLSRTQYTLGPVSATDVEVRNNIPNNCLIFPRAALQQRRFEPSLILFEDWEFLLGALTDTCLHYLPIRGPIVHKNDRKLGERRGASNDDKLVESLLEVYRRRPARSEASRANRKAYLSNAGVDYPADETEAPTAAGRKMRLFQIVDSELPPNGLAPGFQPLDNRHSARPDWREYWPIRNFLLANPVLEEGCLYGFLPAEFWDQTGLTANQLQEFASAQADCADVVSYSPGFDQTAMFLNVFEQGEAHHPGLMALAQRFASDCGMDARLDTLVGHTGNTIHGNYFLAKPRFWREWLRINELLFGLCESEGIGLGHGRAAGNEPNAILGFKIPLMERTASLLLATGEYVCRPYRPMDLPRSGSLIARLDQELTIANALKLAHALTGEARYLKAFGDVRQKAIAGVTAQNN